MKTTIAAILAASFMSIAHAGGGSVITLESLREMFANMKSNTKWNLDGDLLWGYFFTDPNPSKLKPVAVYLEKSGYRFVNIYPTDDKTTYFLHVEKIEHHTPTSLNKRNQEFYKLAERYGLESYDGMDVGPVGK
jgi:hypothetical protein